MLAFVQSQSRVYIVETRLARVCGIETVLVGVSIESNTSTLSSGWKALGFDEICALTQTARKLAGTLHMIGEAA
jgi:hypothetical protein